MKKFRLLLFLLLVFCSRTSHAQPDTLRIASYNLLNFPGNNGSSRLSFFKTVIKSINPDILVVQELQSQAGQIQFLNEVLNYDNGSMYKQAPFINGPDTDNGLFYKHQKVTLVSNRQIKTALRDISEYVLTAFGSELRIYSLHLKAGQGSQNENRRLTEATILRNYLNDLGPDYNFIVTGDFNIYNASESAFQVLTESQFDNDGRLIDPLQAIGVWHNNRDFASIHTQSTRTTSFGGGSTGGLDDRFDMILVSTSLVTEGDMDVLPGSYTSLGNDGQHFNVAINFGDNILFPDSLINALFQASDHLPVYADFVVSQPTSVTPNINGPQPEILSLSQNYPNPFNHTTSIPYSLDQASHVTLKVYDLTGRQVAVLVDELKSPGNYRVAYNANNLASGVYVYQVQAGGIRITRKLILLK
jgi:endonuclease/exonuclease/phosphatase family metal-dependent hydrolase